MLDVPRAQGLRIAGAEENSANSSDWHQQHSFHQPD
jgi:hypothetical protein